VCRKLVTMLAVFMLAGCAAGGQASSAGDLELVIQNERQERMTAYVQWYQSREVRLGDVRAGRERTFEVPMRGREVRVTFGNTSSRNGQGFTDFVQVNAGESWEWTITTGSVFFRRLSQ